MRFPRNAKVFRGHLDPAPVAGVFLIMIAFVQLGSLLYTPGSLIQIGAEADAGANAVTVTTSNTVVFEGRVYSNRVEELDQLRLDLRKIPVGEPVRLAASPGAPARLVEQVANLTRIEPPVSESGWGTDDPVAMVAVNPRGQFFFENQLCNESQLRSRLEERVRVVPGNKLTLVLLADRSVTEEMIVRLGELARKAGISQVILSTRPSEPSATSKAAP
jgi:biopolymer transport protein ExbD